MARFPCLLQIRTGEGGPRRASLVSMGSNILRLGTRMARSRTRFGSSRTLRSGDSSPTPSPVTNGGFEVEVEPLQRKSSMIAPPPSIAER